MMTFQLFFWCLFGFSCVAYGCVPTPAPPTPDTNLPTIPSVDPNSITLGGFSSGSSFSTQFHVAYSTIIKGVGLFCGFPELTSLQTNDAATGGESISVDQLVQDTLSLESQNGIDSTENLANSKIFIVHGTKDEVVDPEYAPKVVAYYKKFAVSSSQIVAKLNIEASHAVVSNRRGAACGEMNYPTFIENCQEDTVKEMFQHLYPNIVGPGNDGELSSTLKSFNQVEFFDNHGSSSMSETGYYYVPASCNDNGNSCYFHVFFHGCAMSADNIGTEFIENSGLLEMSEANNIVLLFPQIKKSNWFSNNPHGCWNQLGYMNDLHNGAYARKDAVQMKGIFKMLNRITGGALE